ncbi:hypothetical protein GCM10009700_07670 [Brevibacterium sanguinis]|uniref:tripartite tricarboxylate transporter TctB family protein n=1 Tax=Brevibacterium sanguinis TaxID=232444 RepID=UPI0031E35D5E
MTATRRDLVTGVVVAVIGVIYYIATFSIQETTDIVTPRTFPAIVGAGLIILGLFLAGQALWQGRTASADAAAADAVPRDATPAAAEPGDTAPETASGVVLPAPEDPPARRVVLQFALFFVYLAIVIPVGFLLSTAAFLMAVTSLYAPEKWIRNLLYSVLFSVIIYVAFVYGLQVYLPVGILG